MNCGQEFVLGLSVETTVTSTTLLFSTTQYSGAVEQYPTVDPTKNIPVSQIPLVETNLHVSILRPRMSTNADVLSI